MESENDLKASRGFRGDTLSPQGLRRTSPSRNVSCSLNHASFVWITSVFQAALPFSLMTSSLLMLQNETRRGLCQLIG